MKMLKEPATISLLGVFAQAREILDAHGSRRMQYYGAQSITALF